MRRHVRYSPLGKVKQINLIFGLPPQVREAEVRDESMVGFGLLVHDVGGLAVGQTVQLESRRGKVSATVVRVEPMGNNSYNVGVHFLPQRGP